MNRTGIVGAALLLLVLVMVALFFVVFDPSDGDEVDRPATTGTQPTTPDPGDAEISPEAEEVFETLSPEPTAAYEGAPSDLAPEAGGSAEVATAPDGEEELIITRADGSTSAEVELGPDGRPTEARYFNDDGELELIISGVRPLPGTRATGGANPAGPLRVRCGSASRKAAPWRFQTFPQRWKLNVRSVPPALLRQGGLLALRKARSTWIRNHSHCRNIRDSSRVRFRYTGGTRRGVGLNGISSIGFGNTARLGGVCPGTVACTLTWVSGGRVVESDTRFNSRIRGGFSVRRRANAFDLQSVMTHELGHTLGVEHVNAPTNVMYPFARRGNVSARRLGRGDALLNNSKY